MGMIFGGWAREDAEEELWYIKKYGLEVGQVAYRHALAVQAGHTEWCKANPVKPRWSKTEPRVTDGDLIVKYEKEPFRIIEEMRVTRIDDEGNIWGRLVTNHPNKDPHWGAEYMWEGEYAKLAT